MKTDNSHFNEKVRLRNDVVRLLEKDSIDVLECYAGKGLLWEEVKRQNPGIKINLLQIEKEKGKNKNALCGDNIKFIASLSLERFDIIDMDAYGIPAKQLEIVFKKGYRGIVVVTSIQSMMGNVPKAILKANGITDKMISKSPTIFSHKCLCYLLNYLYLCGVQQVKGYFLTKERKSYFYFKK